MEDADIRQVGDEEDEDGNDRDNEDGKDEVEENTLSVKKYSFKNWPKHVFLRGKIAVFGVFFVFRLIKGMLTFSSKKEQHQVGHFITFLGQ